jgi:LysM repeat protein
MCTGAAHAQTLKGSPASIEKQYRTALANGYAFVNTARSVQDFIVPGQLVRVSENRDLELHAVSYPYAVPATSQFLARLSEQYYSACGEKLTVTSLLRPRDRQPANSVARSVHPAGMAIDLRVPRTYKCRAWLEQTLLSLEKQRVVEATRERRPPHFHVAVLAGSTATGLAANSYQVVKGDTLSQIASRTGVGVPQLRAANGLQGNLIKVGQKLQIPAAAGATTGVAATTEVLASVESTNEITYRVTRGDTLWRIANRYGTSVQKLRQTNSQAGDALQVGQVLKISKG